MELFSSVVSDKITFHEVLVEVSVFRYVVVVSVVSDETILHVLSTINVVNNECILICSLPKQRSQRIYLFIFTLF